MLLSFKIILKMILNFQKLRLAIFLSYSYFLANSEPVILINVILIKKVCIHIFFYKNRLVQNEPQLFLTFLILRLKIFLKNHNFSASAKNIILNNRNFSLNYILSIFLKIVIFFRISFFF